MPDGTAGAAVATALRYACDVHGVGLVVDADDPAVIAAVKLRMRGFPSLSGRRADLSVTYCSRAAAELPDGPRRPIYDTPDGTFAYLPDHDQLVGQIGDVTVSCVPADGRASLHSSDFSGRALYLATHPILTVCLVEMLKRRGLYGLHAACLADPASERAVLLAGPSGSGKSTLTLALARAGLEFLSDDFVFLSGAGPVRARGFADAIGITGGTSRMIARLGGRAPAPSPDGFPKRLGRIEDVMGRAARPSGVPTAIVFPDVRPAPSAVRELDPGVALLRLVPDVLLTEATATQAHLATIGALLEQSRCYELVSGFDLERAAELTAALI